MRFKLFFKIYNQIRFQKRLELFFNFERENLGNSFKISKESKIKYLIRMKSDLLF